MVARDFVLKCVRGMSRCAAEPSSNGVLVAGMVPSAWR